MLESDYELLKQYIRVKEYAATSRYNCNITVKRLLGFIHRNGNKSVLDVTLNDVLDFKEFLFSLLHLIAR